MTHIRTLTATVISGLIFLTGGVLFQSATGWAQPTDTDGDGIPDSAENSIGGDPLHKDLFIECDYMVHDLNGDQQADDPGEHSHKLKPDAVAIIESVFQNAPVSNPDGQPGITLHLDQGILDGQPGQGNALPDQRFLDFTSRRGGGDFYDIKSANFDFANRAPYFHYCILAHNSGEEYGSASGRAETFGNDFILTLGSWPDEDGNPGGTVKDQAGTFLHELGHNLGLDHGGGHMLPPAERAQNYKPNYISVMNYAFQVSGMKGGFDFSSAVLPTLMEKQLSEPLGIQNGPVGTRYFCNKGRKLVRTAGGAIDWNCKGNIQPAMVEGNLNADRTVLGLPLQDNLRGYDDWSNLRYDFQTAPTYDATGVSGFAQHRTHLGAYRPADTTSLRGVDREPEATWLEGRCLEFVHVRKVGRAFKTDRFKQLDVDRDNLGDACAQESP